MFFRKRLTYTQILVEYPSPGLSVRGPNGVVALTVNFF